MHHQPSISRRLLATSPMVQLMLPPIPGTAARSAYDGLGNFTDTTALKKLRAEKLRAKTIPPPPLPSVNNMIRYSDDLVKTALNIITKDFEVRRGTLERWHQMQSCRFCRFVSNARSPHPKHLVNPAHAPGCPLESSTLRSACGGGGLDAVKLCS
jgi:hypothetical protein